MDEDPLDVEEFNMYENAFWKYYDANRVDRHECELFAKWLIVKMRAMDFHKAVNFYKNEMQKLVQKILVNNELIRSDIQA